MGNAKGFDGWSGSRLVNPVTGVPVRSARLLAEEASLDAMRAAASVPMICGDDIAPSPARGAFRVFEPLKMVPGSVVRQTTDGHRGRHAIARADVFDTMEQTALAAHMRRHPKAPFVPPFSPGQVQAARHYRDLVERHAGGGTRCSSLEAGRGGDGNGGGFMDTWLTESREIAGLQRRAVAGAPTLVLSPARHQDRDNARRAIRLPELLVAVCLHELTLSAVLKRFGWQPRGAHVRSLREALAEALERMRG